MAEKVKIAEIDIGVDKLVKSAGEAKQEIESLRKAQRELKKDTDGLKNATSEQLNQFAKNDVEIKNLSKSYRNSIKVVDAYINIQNQDIRTKDQARDANLKLIAIANQLDSSNEDQAATLKKVNAEIDKNTDFIKENSSEFEKTKLNIGNYKESIKEALNESGLFGDQTKAVNDIMVSFAPVFDNLKKDFKEGAALIRGNTEATEGLTKAQRIQAIATNLSSGALKIFRAALIGTGIGAIVILFGSLISYLSTTQEGIDKVNKILAPTKEIFKALFGVVQNFGKALFDALSNPKKLIVDIGKSIKENLINRFTALGKIIEAVMNGDISGIGDGIVQAATGVENLTGKVKNAGKETSKFFADAAKRGKEIADRQVEIEEGANELILLEGKYKEQIKEANKAAEDASRSQKEREEGAKRSLEISEKLLAAQNSQLDLQIQQKKEQHKANDTNREEIKELNELIAKRNENNAAALELQTTQQTKLNSIRAQVESEKNKNYQEALSRQSKLFDMEISRNELSIKNFIAEQGFAAKTAQEELQLAQTVFEKQKEIEEKKLAAGKTSQEELNLFIRENQNNIAKLQAEIAVDLANRELEIFKQGHLSKLEAGQFLNEQLFNQEQERLNQIAEKQKEFEATRLEQGIISQQDYNDAIAEVNEQTFQKQETLRLERAEAKKEQEAFELVLKQELEDERFENQFELEREREERRYQSELLAAEKLGADLSLIRQKHAAASEAITEAEEEAKLNSSKGTFGEISKLLGEKTAHGKAAGIAEATISTYQGVARVWETPSLLPEPIATAQKVISTGVVLGSGLQAVKKIVSTKIPRAERGISMDLNGPSHSQGGINLYDENGNPLVNAQGGEKMVILKREASQELAALSQLNQKHGGVSLSTPVTYANNGGAVNIRPSTGSVKIPKNIFDYEALGNVLAERVNNIKNVVPVDQINTLNRNNAIVDNRANL